MLRQVFFKLVVLTAVPAVPMYIGMGTAFAQSNIDPAHKFAWGENVGWTNWRDANGGAQGVAVDGSFMGGFIWGENVGWINVGDGTPGTLCGGLPCYANGTGVDFGVNVDFDGSLHGFAWGENIGWINFDGGALASPPNPARFDAAAGRLRGYAWGENVGWINLDDAVHFVGVIAAVNIASANPPTAAANPYAPGQPFRDVLDTGTSSALTAGIGGAGTAPQGAISYAPINVTFSAAPSPAPAVANVTIACTGGSCPTVTAVSGSGAGPYSISLSGAIPPRQCTTLTFAGTAPGQKLQYQSLPGDVNLDGTSNTVDLLALVTALNNGTANLAGNLARYNVDRMGGVNTQDLLRLVQLLNGTNATQSFNGATIAACP
ncbi:MAG TPA: hypothetical protein VGM03_08425 [Phycisphaerae bacterium]|jgi:hypothetical protein